MQLFQLSYSDSFVVQKDFLIFYLQHHQTSYQDLSEWETNSKNFQLFDQNEGYMG